MVEKNKVSDQKNGGAKASRRSSGLDGIIYRINQDSQRKIASLEAHATAREWEMKKEAEQELNAKLSAIRA